jgi:hypothetical protein
MSGRLKEWAAGMAAGMTAGPSRQLRFPLSSTSTLDMICAMLYSKVSARIISQAVPSLATPPHVWRLFFALIRRGTASCERCLLRFSTGKIHVACAFVKEEVQLRYPQHACRCPHR